jgi:hypothetical protein
MRRIVVLAVLFAILLCATLTVAPERSFAGQRLAYGGSSAWTWKWETTSFAVSGPGVVDIWTTCRPKASYVTAHQLLVGLRQINVPCDRNGHWIRRVGIPRNTRLTVLAHAYKSNGLFCYTECATGWTSVYSVP